MRCIAGCAVLLCGLCGAASGGYVDLDLTIDPGHKTWQVYAQVQGGSLGLDGFSFDVVGSGGVAISSSLNEAPIGLDGASTWGFHLFRSNGTSGMAIMAAQDSVYGPAYDSALDALVLRNVGILAGGRSSNGQPVSWDAKVLLASGAYSGVGGAIAVAARPGEQWSLLQDIGGTWSGPGHLAFATAIHGDSAIAPLPGDVNVDGTVNSTDLGLLLTHYNQLDAGGAAGWAMGDVDNNGTVNSTDLGLLLTYYNQTVGAASTVPEPSTLLLIASGLLGLLWLARNVSQNNFAERNSFRCERGQKSDRRTTTE